MNSRSPLGQGSKAVRILPDHAAVLRCLALDTAPNGERCVPFRPIIEATGLPRQRVRFICRFFARNGLAEFHKALWTEDGEVAGSGYCITYKGYQVLTSSRSAAKTALPLNTKDGM